MRPAEKVGEPAKALSVKDPFKSRSSCSVPEKIKETDGFGQDAKLRSAHKNKGDADGKHHRCSPLFWTEEKAHCTLASSQTKDPNYKQEVSERKQSPIKEQDDAKDKKESAKCS